MNPLNGETYTEHLFNVNSIEKTKTKKKEARNGTVFKKQLTYLIARKALEKLKYSQI